MSLFSKWETYLSFLKDFVWDQFEQNDPVYVLLMIACKSLDMCTEDDLK